MAKLIIDEWIIREVINTLYMANNTLLGITGLDSPQEIAKKKEKECAINRAIYRAIDILQQGEQPQLLSDKDRVRDGEVILNGHWLFVDTTKWADGYKLKVIMGEEE